MFLFERNAEVDRLAGAAESARSDDDRVLLQTMLAWYLRQQDNARANALVLDTRQRLETLALPSETAQQLAARLALVDAETCWLQSELESALQAASTALADGYAVASVGQSDVGTWRRNGDAGYCARWSKQPQDDRCINFVKRDGKLAATAPSGEVTWWIESSK